MQSFEHDGRIYEAPSAGGYIWICFDGGTRKQVCAGLRGSGKTLVCGPEGSRSDIRAIMTDELRRAGEW